MLIPKILLSYSEYVRQRTPNRKYDYVSEFEKAQNNTKRLKLEMPEFSFDKETKLTKDLKDSLVDLIDDEVFSYRQEEIAFNCFFFAELANNVIQQNLKRHSPKKCVSVIF